MAFAQNRHAHLTDGHGFDHIFRVYKLAEHILADYPQANRDLVLTAALLPMIPMMTNYLRILSLPNKKSLIFSQRLISPTLTKCLRS